MSAAPQIVRYTEDEYLVMERESDSKHEYIDGEILAMASETAQHNRIAGSISANLYMQTQKRPCAVYNSAQRVQAARANSYLYPDVTVVCGQTQFSKKDANTIINPTVIIEVLSPSTEYFDHVQKFALYRRLDSLREYVLVSQDQAVIEHRARQDNDAWVLNFAIGAESVIELVSIGCVLSVADVYEKAELT